MQSPYARLLWGSHSCHLYKDAKHFCMIRFSVLIEGNGFRYLLSGTHAYRLGFRKTGIDTIKTVSLPFLLHLLCDTALTPHGARPFWAGPLSQQRPAPGHTFRTPQCDQDQVPLVTPRNNAPEHVPDLPGQIMKRGSLSFKMFNFDKLLFSYRINVDGENVLSARPL